MSYRIYIDSILEPIVALWYLEEASWCLEEESDSGHSKGLRSNLVLRWKMDYRISLELTALYRQFFNYR